MAALILLIGLILFFTVRGIAGNNRLLEFPTLAGIIYLAYFVPQTLAAERNPLMRAYDPWVLWLYMAACLVMIAVGFAIGKYIGTKRVMRVKPAPVEVPRYVFGTAFLLGVGLLSLYRINVLAVEANAISTSWTGEITAWFLLMECLFFAFGMACLGYFKVEKRQLFLVVGAIAFIAIGSLIAANIKRTLIAEAVVIMAGTWFFYTRRQPPRPLTIAALLLGTVLLHQVGVIRSHVINEGGTVIGAVMEGQMFSEFRYFTYDESPELGQAMVDVYGTRRSDQLEGTDVIWNAFVHQYVPSFILGRDFKDSLMKPVATAADEDYRLDVFDYEGATRTGFSDSYRSFGAPGMLVFALIGGIFGWLYALAMSGRVWAQLYYLLLINDGLLAITEGTYRFFITLPFLLVMTGAFVIPGYFLSRKVARPRRMQPFRSNFRGQGRAGMGPAE